uniref:CrV1 protein n=5 Tax=root TaxID=1 RepID=A7KBS3_COTSE|nr:CrV1 protein [Cotesia sesamiae]CCQ19174.1 CRV1 protein [Cotesia sesamiae Kitale bracovirus]
MSLVKSAFVLLSALLCQSCTQVLPSPYQWEGIPENRFAPVAPLSPLTHRSSPKSDFSAKRIMPSTNTFDEIDVHNRKFSMIPKHHSEAPRKQSNFEDFLRSQHPYMPRHLKKHRSSTKTRPFERYISGIFNERSGTGLPGSIIASGVFSGPENFVGDLHFTQPELFDAPRTQQPGNEFETSGKRYVTREDLFSELRAIEKALQKLTFAVIQIDDGFNSNTFTTSPQPPVLIDPSVASDSEPKEPSVEGVTSPTVTTSPQPPVLNNPSVISKQGPIEANTKEEVTYPTVATSAQLPVPIDSSVTSKQGPIEANNEEKVTYPTLTTSMKPPVLMDPREQYELQMLESLYETMHENNARKEEAFEKDF